MGSRLPGSPDFFPSTKRRHFASLNETKAFGTLAASSSLSHWGTQTPQKWEKLKGRRKKNVGEEGSREQERNCRDGQVLGWATEMELGPSQGCTG